MAQKNSSLDLFCLFLFLISSFFLIHSFTSQWSLSYTPGLLGTASLPRACIYLMFIGVLGNFIHCRFYGFSIEPEYRINVKEILITVIFTISIIIYIYSVYYIGLLVSTILFLLIWQIIFGVTYKNYVYFLLTTLIGSIIIYYLVNIANVFLPKSILF